MRTTSNEQGKLAKSAAITHVAFDVVDLGPFDNNRNDLKAINDRGQGVGISLNTTTGRAEAFLEEKGKRIDLGTLGGSFSVAHDINNRGEIVGGSLTEGDESFHAFIFRGNRLLDLNDLLDPNEDWVVLQAVGINNCGEIVGIGCQSGQDRIILLRPRI